MAKGNYRQRRNRRETQKNGPGGRFMGVYQMQEQGSDVGAGQISLQLYIIDPATFSLVPAEFFTVGEILDGSGVSLLVDAAPVPSLIVQAVAVDIIQFQFIPGGTNAVLKIPGALAGFYTSQGMVNPPLDLSVP